MTAPPPVRTCPTPDDVQPLGPAPRPKSRGMMLLRYGFVAAVVIALAVLLWQQRDEVALALRSISPGLVLLSLLLGMFGAALPGLVWRDLLASQGYRTAPVAGLRVFFIAQLGKYLPGGIWNLVAQVDMARDLRIPARQAAAATFLSVALSVIAALLVAGVTLPFAIPGLVSEYWWAFLAVPALVLLLLPPVVAWWSALAFRVLRRPATPVRLTWPVLLRGDRAAAGVVGRAGPALRRAGAGARWQRGVALADEHRRLLAGLGGRLPDHRRARRGRRARGGARPGLRRRSCRAGPC